MMINKIKGIAIFFALILFFVGCGEKETKTVYTNTINGVELTFTFYAKGNEVIKQAAKNKIPYSVIKVSNKDEAKAKIEPMSKLFQGIKGIEEKIEYFDDYAIETLFVDLEKVDFEKASTLPGSMFGEDLKSGEKVSLKKCTEILEKDGFKKME